MNKLTTPILFERKNELPKPWLVTGTIKFAGPRKVAVTKSSATTGQLVASIKLASTTSLVTINKATSLKMLVGPTKFAASSKLAESNKLVALEAIEAAKPPMVPKDEI